MHILAALQNYRPEAQGEELEGGEHAGRTGTNDYYSGSLFDIFIIWKTVGFVLSGRVGLIAIAP